MNTISRALACLSLAAVLSACGPSSSPSADGSPAMAALPQAVVSVPVEPVPQAAEGDAVAELMQRATQALQADHLFEPAGDNALELYLAAIVRAEAADEAATEDGQRRNRRLSDALASDDRAAPIRLAVGDILPYGLVWVERAIQAEQFDKAERVMALLERAQAGSSSVQRLRDQLAQAKVRLTPAQVQAVAAMAEERRQEPAAAATTQLAASPMIETAEPTRAPATPAPPTPTAVAALTPTNTPPPARPLVAQQTPARPVPTPRLLSQPSLRYPTRAQRSRIEGFVEVSYLIRRDGSTSEPKILSAEPEGIFDREAIRIAEGLKFAPLSEEIRGEQRIDFRLATNN